MRLGVRAGLHDQTALAVEREPEQAHVVVAQAGFTRGPSTRTGIPVSYGIQVVNDSYEFDAVGVTVRWRLEGTDGGRLAGDTVALAAVPASTTFYVGGVTRVAADAVIGRATTGAEFRLSRKRRVFLPVAADVHFVAHGPNRVRLTGKLTNAYARPLSGSTAIYAVVFDRQGRLIGGAVQKLARVNEGLPPGQTAGFSIDVLTPSGVDRGAFVAVSVDP
jgi:hypothetical protein